VAATEPSQRDVSRIPGADGLRALAALGVVFSHLFQRLSAQGHPEWLDAVQGIAMKGAYGVSIFFVLSGMLLSFPFWRAYFTGEAMPRLGHYTRRRAARIIPGFYASLLVSFAVGLLIFPDAPSTVLRLISGLTFTSGFYWLTFFPVESNGPLWSISLEVVSYVLMPLAMLAMFAIHRRGRRIAAGYWLSVLVAVLLVNQWIITNLIPSDEGKGWQYGITGGGKEWVPFYNPVGFFAHFLMGIFAAAFIAWWRVRKDGGRRWGFDLVALFGLGCVAGLVWITRFPLEPTFHNNIQQQPYLWPALAASAGVALVGMSHSKVVGAVMDNPFARFTATVSFGIYIWHYLVLHLMSYLTYGEFEYGGVQDPIRFMWICLAVLVMTYAIASASWYWLEKPVLNSRWARRR
jgi:peptidoglycan/LPS O-acetylase OafA/YrhL